MMDDMDLTDWPTDADGRPLGACPCGEPLDGHHHWPGYWQWCAQEQQRQLLVRAFELIDCN